MKTEYRAHLALFVTSLIFGANYWISKGLMPFYLDALQLVVIRTFFAVIIFWLLAKSIKPETIARKDILRLIVAATLGTTVNQVFFFIGLNLSTPVDVSIIHVSNPVFVTIFAAILINERVTFLKIFGIFLGASGAVILILYGNEINFNADTFTGNLFAMVNMIGYAFYLVLIKPLLKSYHPFTVMKWVFMVGLITTLPFSVGSLSRLSFLHFETVTWLSLLYIIVPNTLFAYLLTIYALKRVEASMASYYIYLQPVIVVAIAYWLGVQNLTWDKLLAAAFIFTGVYLVSKKK